jgi:multiple sugar transport system ATP-binding protein
MRVELKKLHERLATTAVYVTHDQVEAMTMGDRIVVMKDGFIQQVGGPLDLYNHPANQFVGGFLGSPAMNFFEADLVETDDSVGLQADGFRIDLPPEKSKSLEGYPEKRVTVGIRPEDLLVARDHIPGKTIPLNVDVVEPIGSETYVVGNAGQIPLIAGVGRQTHIKAHDSVVLEPIIDQLHLFDIRDEQALF